MNKQSLLPGNLGDLERDLDAAIARMESLDVPISALWDPWQCPLDLLPWLAWAVSVDTWKSTWPESIKRRTVANSLDLHRIKGTRPAVELAIESLGLDYRLVEWFQETPAAPRGTFTLDIYVGDDAYSTTSNRDLEHAIDAAKNARSHLRKVNLNLTGTGDTFLGAGHVSGETTEIRPWSVDAVEVSAAACHAVSVHSSDVLSLYPKNTVSLTVKAALSLLASIQSTDVISLTPGVQ